MRHGEEDRQQQAERADTYRQLGAIVRATKQVDEEHDQTECTQTQREQARFGVINPVGRRLQHPDR